MFEAYSTQLKDIVNVQTQFDLKEIFHCPNPNCSAKFKIRSASGKRAKHFARLRSTQHSDDCFYKDVKSDYINGDTVIKLPIEEIYNSQKSIKNSNSNAYSPKTKPTGTSNSSVFIRTPKQLYYFCISNSLDTPFCNNLLVKDIVLDYRNLFENKNFLGISGLRLIIAETYRYDQNKNIVKLKLKRNTKTGKLICLKIELEMEHDLFQNLIQHILKTNNNEFKGYPVAVLGNWEIMKEYRIRGIVKSDKHLLFK